MSSLRTALLLALVAGPFILTGCERTRQTEIEPDGSVDTDTEVRPADDMDGDTLAAEGEAALDSAGAALGRAADSTAATVGRVADRVEDVIDSNVDLGDDAQNQGD